MTRRRMFACGALAAAIAWVAISQAQVTETPRRRGDELARRLKRVAPGGLVEIEANTYEVDAGLVIDKSNVTLRGAGVGKTIIKARFTGARGAVLTVGDPDFDQVTRGPRWHLARPAATADDRIELGDGDGGGRIQAGVALLVRVPNDGAFLDGIGARKWRRQYPYVRQTLTRVARVEDKAIILERPLGVDFPDGSEVMLAPVVTGVVVEGLTVHYDLGADPDPLSYENSRPVNTIDGLYVHGAVSPTLRNIEVIDAGSHAVALDNVLYPLVQGVSARGSWNKGTEGNGYFRISRTYYGTFDHLVLRGLRHLAIQWSSHDNNLAAIDADCDVNFHGGFTQRNQVQAADLTPRPGHKWGRVTRTPGNAGWAPPDGVGNVVIDQAGHVVPF